MPPRYATLMALMEEVGRARGVRVKTTLVETGHRRPRRALAAASTPGSDRNAGNAPAAPISAPAYAGPVSHRGRRRAAGRPPVTVSTPPQQDPRAAAQPPPGRGSAAPAGRGIVRAGGGSREAVANLSGAGARAPAPGNLASGPARGGQPRPRPRRAGVAGGGGRGVRGGRGRGGCGGARWVVDAWAARVTGVKRDGSGLGLIAAWAGLRGDQASPPSIAVITARTDSRDSESESKAAGRTSVAQRSNRDATEMQQLVQQRCNRDATEMPQVVQQVVQQRCNCWCNRGAANLVCKSTTELQQRCNRDATEVQQRCNSWCNRGAA